MRFIIPLCATILASLGVNSNPVTPNDPLVDFWKARTIFNSQFLQQVDHRARGKNWLVSTIGVHSAMTALMAGAKDLTFGQLWNTLGYGTTQLEKQQIIDLYRDTLANITELQFSGINFQNLFVFDENLEIDPNYEITMMNSFGANLLKENFHTKSGAEKATDDINNWVDQVTHGSIPRLFDGNLSPDTSAVLANALRFKQEWGTPFNPSDTFVGEFTRFDFTKKNVTYMKISSSALKGSRYSRNFGFRNLEIPFGDGEGRLWFGIMLADLSPDRNFDCCSAFTEFIHGTHETPVDLVLPKFDISSVTPQMQDVLMKMGLNDLFDSQAADLSGISDQRGLYLSNVASKLKMSINEAGASGASASGEALATSSPALGNEKAVQFTVDRPFIFTISDRPNNIDFIHGFVYEP